MATGSSFLLWLRRFIGNALGKILPLGILAVGLFLSSDYQGVRYGRVKAFWSWAVVAPQLQPAQAAFKAGDTTQALALALPILRAHPTDTRALYLVAGLYWDAQSLPLATFYTVAFLRSPEPQDPKQAAQFGLILAGDADNARYLADSIGYQDAHDFITSIDMPPETKVELYLAFQSAARKSTDPEDAGVASDFAADRDLYSGMPVGWQRTTAVTAPELLTASPDEPWQGLLTYDKPTDCRSTFGPWCAEAITQAKLYSAVATGIAKTTEDSRCHPCALSLNDPDLRPLSEITKEFLERWTKSNPGDLKKSAAGQNALLALRERVLWKQRFLLVYATSALPVKD